MANFLIFLTSCALIVISAGYFARLGKSALITWIAILSLLANLFVLKQIELLGFNATASDVFAIGSLLGLNLLQEQHGSDAAKQSIWISFCILIFFVVMSQMHLLYVPSRFDEMQNVYAQLLNPAPRILMASLFTFFIVQQFDRKLYGLLRRIQPRTSIALISAASMVVSQLLDTVLFSIFGLYGIVAAIGEIIVVSYVIKLLAIGATLPWSFLTRKYLSHVN